MTEIRFFSLILIPLLLFSPFTATHVEEVPPPDIVIERVAHSPRYPKPGGKINLEVTVKDRGEGPYRGDLGFQVYLEGKKIADWATDGNLGPGQGETFLFHVLLPGTSKRRLSLKVLVTASREPKKMRHNNWYSTYLFLGPESKGKEREWEFLGARPKRVDVKDNGEKKVEALFKKGGPSNEVNFYMLLEGRGRRWTLKGTPQEDGERVRVFFSIGKLSLPPGSYRGEFLIRGKGWKRVFIGGPLVVVRGRERGKERGYVPGEVLLVFSEKEVAVGRLLGMVRRERGVLVEKRRSPLLGFSIYLVRFSPDWRGYGLWKRALERSFPGVRVERNRVFRVLGSSDPYMAFQHYRQEAGFREIKKVRGEVRIGIVDTGYDYHHEDLQGAATERMDVVGSKGKGFSREAHGTEVMGIIGARCGNGKGICGLAPFAKIIFVRACWEEGDGRGESTTFLLIKALDFLASRRPQIVNMSIGGGFDPLLKEALEALTKVGTVVVAASSRVEGEPSYPGAFPFVLGVGGLNSRGSPEEGEKPDLWAPGEEILTTYPGNEYRFVSGPSMAAAIATAALAVLKGRYPGLSPEELRSLAKKGKRMVKGAPVLDVTYWVKGEGSYLPLP